MGVAIEVGDFYRVSLLLTAPPDQRDLIAQILREGVQRLHPELKPVVDTEDLNVRMSVRVPAYNEAQAERKGIAWARKMGHVVQGVKWGHDDVRVGEVILS